MTADPRLRNRVKELVLDGIYNLPEVRRNLRQFSIAIYVSKIFVQFD